MKITITIKSFVDENDGLFFEKSFDGLVSSTVTHIMEWLISKKTNFGGAHSKTLEFKVNDRIEITNFVDYDVLMSTVILKAASFISGVPVVQTIVPVNSTQISTPVSAAPVGQQQRFVKMSLSDPYRGVNTAMINKVRTHISNVFPGMVVKHIGQRGRSLGQMKIGKTLLSISKVCALSGNPNDQFLQIPTEWHDSQFLIVFNEFAADNTNAMMSERVTIYARSHEMKSGRMRFKSFTIAFADTRILDYFTAITHMQNKLSISNAS